jgi:hypothetical protein
MHLPQEATEKSLLTEDTAEPSFYPRILALRRYSHFCAFLRDDLEACRTETERKVVLSVLLTTRLRIRELAASLNLLAGKGQDAVHAS